MLDKDIFHIDDFDVDIDPELPAFIISVVSEMVDLPVWTLRELDKEGIVCPRRKGKKHRLYCKKDLKKLEYIHYLIEERGVNLSGIRVILELEGKEQV